MKFATFFTATTGYDPYDYQRRLAGDAANTPCAAQLITVPTGLGKTAAVVLAWLWHRLAPNINSQAPNQPWPRRVIGRLPF